MSTEECVQLTPMAIAMIQKGESDNARLLKTNDISALANFNVINVYLIVLIRTMR